MIELTRLAMLWPRIHTAKSASVMLTFFNNGSVCFLIVSNSLMSSSRFLALLVGENGRVVKGPGVTEPADLKEAINWIPLEKEKWFTDTIPVPPIN